MWEICKAENAKPKRRPVEREAALARKDDVLALMSEEYA
jgi:hypothetical protein